MQVRKGTRRRKVVERETEKREREREREREGGGGGGGGERGRERERETEIDKERERIIKNEKGRQIMDGSLLGPLQELPYTESVSSRFVKEER